MTAFVYYCFSFLLERRNEELYILFRDISKDIFTKKRIVLSGTYCQNERKSNTNKNSSRKPVPYRLPAVFVTLTEKNITSKN